MSDQPGLSRLLHEVGSVPPPASDYAPGLRRAVARRRLLRLSGAGAAVVVLAGAGVVAAGTDRGPEQVLEARPAASPTSTASAEPEPTGPPSPDPLPSSAAPSPSRPPAPAPTTAAAEPEPDEDDEPETEAPRPRTAQPRPSPRPRRTTQQPAPPPEPEQTWAPRGLRVTLSAPSSVADGSSVRFTVSIRDNDGHVLSGRVDFGDGSSATFTAGSTCGDSGNRDPEPLDTSVTRSHTYLGPGSYTAEVTVTTGSSCRDTPRETRTDSATVEVS